ncbi:MAG: hypothetical protein M9944_14070 [Rhizobiaceae bacterium]|nr:hypothetical protein [Rhizobiaceae bacterium]
MLATKTVAAADRLHATRRLGICTLQFILHNAKLSTAEAKQIRQIAATHAFA